MARGFGARETGWKGREKAGPPSSSFAQAVAGLSPERIKSLSDSIFFPDIKALRAATQAGYDGPDAKNSFGWFKPEVEKEVSAKAAAWASSPAIRAALSDLWDKGEPGSPHRRTGLHNAYPDKETFIARQIRFIESDYKNTFYSPIATALNWNPANQPNRQSSEEGIRLTGLQTEAGRAWDALMRQETARIRQESLDWLKGRI